MRRLFQRRLSVSRFIVFALVATVGALSVRSASAESLVYFFNTNNTSPWEMRVTLDGVALPNVALANRQGRLYAFPTLGVGAHSIRVDFFSSQSVTGLSGYTIRLPRGAAFAQTGTSEVGGLLNSTTNRDDQYDFSVTTVTPPIVITALEFPVPALRSFVTTDTMRLRARLGIDLSFVPVDWTITGQQAAQGLQILVPGQTTLTDANGAVEFPFRPADSNTLVLDRFGRFGRAGPGRCGSENESLAFEVSARVQVGSQAFTTALSQTTLGPISQDAIDRLRQEYVDFEVQVPTRDQIVPTIPGFNTGNYQYQLSVDLPGKFASILSSYRTNRHVTLSVTDQGTTYPNVQVPIPPTADIRRTSSYRCPQRNRGPCVGSISPNSPHTRGRALDLEPVAFRASIPLPNGRTVSRWVTRASLRAALSSASGTVGNAYCENGAWPPVSCNPPTPSNHVHVEWQP